MRPLTRAEWRFVRRFGYREQLSKVLHLGLMRIATLFKGCSSWFRNLQRGRRTYESVPHHVPMDIDHLSPAGRVNRDHVQWCFDFYSRLSWPTSPSSSGTRLKVHFFNRCFHNAQIRNIITFCAMDAQIGRQQFRRETRTGTAQIAGRWRRADCRTPQQIVQPSVEHIFRRCTYQGFLPVDHSNVNRKCLQDTPFVRLSSFRPPSSRTSR